MSRIIIGILIIILIIIFFLLFWIAILSIALFLFGKRPRKGNDLSNREMNLYLGGGS